MSTEQALAELMRLPPVERMAAARQLAQSAEDENLEAIVAAEESGALYADGSELSDEVKAELDEIEARIESGEEVFRPWREVMIELKAHLTRQTPERGKLVS